MTSGLYRVGTPEKARKILSKLLKDGKITIQDIDQESPGASHLRETATKYYPEIKLKPHVNLLRTNEPVQEIKVSEERDFPTSPRSEPSVSRERSSLLLQDPQEDRALVSVNDLPW
mgnify:CR=1 FL=1